MGDVVMVVKNVWRDAGELRREFAVFFSGAACAMLLALPTFGFSAAQKEAPLAAQASIESAADYELMTASLHWQAKLALADLQSARGR
jgi:hypothetical protein